MRPAFAAKYWQENGNKQTQRDSCKLATELKSFEAYLGRHRLDDMSEELKNAVLCGLVNNPLLCRVNLYSSLDLTDGRPPKKIRLEPKQRQLLTSLTYFSNRIQNLQLCKIETVQDAIDQNYELDIFFRGGEDDP